MLLLHVVTRLELVQNVGATFASAITDVLESLMVLNICSLLTVGIILLKGVSVSLKMLLFVIFKEVFDNFCEQIDIARLFIDKVTLLDNSRKARLLLTFMPFDLSFVDFSSAIDALCAHDD